MRLKIAKLFGGECGHERTLVVDSVGVRRVVCESCGHISFEMDEVDASQPTVGNQRELPRVAGL